MYLLDTNSLIYFFKGIGRVADGILSKAPNDIGIPAIVLFEIMVGIEKSASPEKRKVQLEQLSGAVTIFSFGKKEAEQAAAIRAKLERQGLPIGPYDVLIAATALSNHCTLVTHNVKEFIRVEGLQIEDWY